MNPTVKPAWDKVRAEFRRLWGYENFRPPQGDIVASLLAQQDALIILPTGAGKSVCFQLPALLQTGLTLVISPLVALMENQVDELQQRRLAAAQFHSELSSRQRQQVLWALEQQQLRLLYLSPEALFSPAIWQRLCHPQLKINGLILDEAHCLVQWGETFRPTYRRLGTIRPALLKLKPPGCRIAIAAFTATADPSTQRVIQNTLQLEQPHVFRLSPYRPNLDLNVQVAWTPRGRRRQLLKFIQTQAEQTGLVYTQTRRDSETLAAWLQTQGYQAAAYHAGLHPQGRRQIEAAWLKGEMIVVCTNAFGMGINKANVRWIGHFHPPLTLPAYIQEVGRAGRDGKPATALTLTSEPTGWLDPDDQQQRKFFADKLRAQQQIAYQLAQKLPTHGDINTVTHQFKHGAIALALLHKAGQLTWQDPFHYVLHQPINPKSIAQSAQVDVEQMTQYLATQDCRWQFLLQAFGFTAEAKNFRCGHCDKCRS